MRKPKRNIRIFTQAEVNKIVQLILNEHIECKNLWSRNKLFYFFRLRNATMILMMFYLGLRPRCCYAQRIEDIDLKNKLWFIRCEQNKQRQSDSLPIPDIAIKPLAAYMAYRNKHFNNNPWLFPAMPNNRRVILGHVDGNTLANIFKRATKNLGYTHKCYSRHGITYTNTPLYSLRHTNVESSFRYIHYSQDSQRRELVNRMFNA